MFAFFDIFLDVLLPVFGIVILGFLVGGRIELQVRSISRIAYYVFVPAFIFQSISNSHIAIDDAVKMTAFIVLSQLLVTVFSGVLGRLLKKSKEMIVAYIMVSIFANVGNYGIAVVHFHLGDAGLAPATIYFTVMSITQLSIGVSAAGWIRGGSKGALLNVLKTPALVAVVPALLVSSTGLPVPLMVSRMVGLLAGAMVPTMLFTLGLQLLEQGKIRFSKDVLLASSIRLLVSPLIAYGVAIPFHLEHLQYVSGVIQIAMPTAIMATIVAKENDIAPNFVNTSVLFTLLASLVTLPLIMLMF